MVGSCCGSSPSFTGAIADEAKVCLPVEWTASGPPVFAVSSPAGRAARRGFVHFVVVGERINRPARRTCPTRCGPAPWRSCGRSPSRQERAGAQLLDVNVGAAGVDAPSALPAACSRWVGMSDLPLVIDTTDLMRLKRSQGVSGARTREFGQRRRLVLASVLRSRRDSAPRSSCSRWTTTGSRPRRKAASRSSSGSGGGRARPASRTDDLVVDAPRDDRGGRSGAARTTLDALAPCGSAASPR